jgi:hypothetical protein
MENESQKTQVIVSDSITFDDRVIEGIIAGIRESVANRDVIILPPENSNDG